MEIVRGIIREADPKIRPFLVAAREAALARDAPKTWDNVFRVGQTAYRAVPSRLHRAINPPRPDETAEVTATRPHIQEFLRAMQFENATIRDRMMRGSWEAVVQSIDEIQAYLDRFAARDAAANAARVKGLSKSGLGVDPLLQATITGYLTGETGLIQEQKEKARAKAGLGGRRKTRKGKGKGRKNRTRKH